MNQTVLKGLTLALAGFGTVVVLSQPVITRASGIALLFSGYVIGGVSAALFASTATGVTVQAIDNRHHASRILVAVTVIVSTVFALWALLLFFRG